MSFFRFDARFAWPSLVVVLLFALVGCGTDAPEPPTPIAPTAVAEPTNTPVPAPTNTPEPTATPEPTPIPEAERGFVPVLSYHHIREWQAADTEDDRAYVMPPAKLEAQLEWLKENGYTSVIAEEVYEYYAHGKPLPEKPIMLSFDDNIDNQYTTAVPLLKKYGFTATFFIMTVTIDKDHFMSAEQLKEMAADGFDIQLHTWDHHMVTTFETEADWRQQLEEPRKTIQELLGYTPDFFAYPAGVYNREAAEKLKEYGYKGAFRLVEVMDQEVEPAFAIKRYIANGYWTLNQFATVVSGGWE